MSIAESPYALAAITIDERACSSSIRDRVRMIPDEAQTNSRSWGQRGRERNHQSILTVFSCKLSFRRTKANLVNELIERTDMPAH